MAGAEKYMKELMKIKGAVKRDYNPFAHVLTCQSPSVNFLFGRSHGLPQGYSVVAYGPAKCGKTLLGYSFAAEALAADPANIVVKFDTERRDQIQNYQTTSESLFGIDQKRFPVIETNTAEGVFDCIETTIKAMIQDGAKIPLIIIDSINSIQGRRGTKNKSIADVTIGDLALTLQEGFKRILEAQRDMRFGLFLTAQARAEMDQYEQKKHGKFKMAASYGVQHFAEYFMLTTKVDTVDGNTDEAGNPFEDDSRKDMVNGKKSEKTAHKIRCVMKGNSAQGSCAGRVAEFTFHYTKGIINQHEEVFNLAVNRGLVGRPNNRTYEFGGKSWSSKMAFVDALKEDKGMQNAILKILREQDMSGNSTAITGTGAKTVVAEDGDEPVFASEEAVSDE